jgi:2-desacetyl-2-hydroxyethyl bacteriochlorophyllide A dehydrogenase
MRALVIDGPRSAHVAEVEPPVAGAGQVVVDVLRAGICGTDVELFTGQLAYFGQGKTRFPVRPGHEWCGVVSAAGAGVSDSWLGARVTGDTMLGCGRCSRCRAGRGHICADRHEIGIMGWPGALAEQVMVPASSLHRLPDAVDDRAGAMVEPGGNAWRAASAAGAGPGKRILVCGPGTIGLLTAAFAAAAGASVHVLALDRGREEMASSFGACAYWTSGDPPPAGYDAVIDATDDPRMPAYALALVEPGGRLVCIGISGVPSLVDSRDLVLGDITAVGILGASAGLRPAIEYYASGRVDPAGLVAVTVGLDRAAEALAGRVGTGSGTKIHVDPRLALPARGPSGKRVARHPECLRDASGGADLPHPVDKSDRGTGRGETVGLHPLQQRQQVDGAGCLLGTGAGAAAAVQRPDELAAPGVPVRRPYLAGDLDRRVHLGAKGSAVAAAVNVYPDHDLVGIARVVAQPVVPRPLGDGPGVVRGGFGVPAGQLG